MLIQAREIYTKAIFEQFQEQFVEDVELNIIKCIEDGEDSLYTVTLYDSYGNEDDCRKRYVKRDSTDMLSCNCRMFEINGVLCSHIIKVLRNNMNIKEILAQYILKRWTKQASSECVQDMYGHEIQADPKLQQTSRYMSLYSMFIRISSRVSKSENAYNLANEYASNLAKLVEDILHLEMNGNEHVKDQNSQDTKKGLKKKETCRGRRKLKSSLEVSLAKKKKKSNPPQHSKVAYLLSMVVNKHYKLAVNGHSLVRVPSKSCNMPNIRSGTSYEQCQQSAFYEWHQQNNSGFLFGIQDNQASASATVHSIS
ncbi:hypothetical protein ACOSP7_027413 [Xanthoceras sorbifolium]